MIASSSWLGNASAPCTFGNSSSRFVFICGCYTPLQHLQWKNHEKSVLKHPSCLCCSIFALFFGRVSIERLLTILTVLTVTTPLPLASRHFAATMAQWSPLHSRKIEWPENGRKRNTCFFGEGHLETFARAFQLGVNVFTLVNRLIMYCEFVNEIIP